jgi:hypothetical protein
MIDLLIITISFAIFYHLVENQNTCRVKIKSNIDLKFVNDTVNLFLMHYRIGFVYLHLRIELDL